MLVGSRLLQAIYRKLTTENLVKHDFLRPKDMRLTKNSNQKFLPWGATELKIQDLTPRPSVVSSACSIAPSNLYFVPMHKMATN